MKLVINSNQYDIDRLTLSTIYLESEEKLSQNLSITVKDGAIANQINVATIKSFKNIITVLTDEEDTITFEGFIFDAFDIYMDNTTERFDLRFNKEEIEEK